MKLLEQFFMTQKDICRGKNAHRYKTNFKCQLSVDEIIINRTLQYIFLF